MIVDLVQTTTRDGLWLDGAFQAAAAPAALGVDAVCLVHGTGGNFYGSTLLDNVAQRCREMGCAVVRINTRGHDGISTARAFKGGRRQGAAYEVVDECRHDIAAWLDWLRRQTGPRLVLMGHSMGAVKAIYALAQEPNPSVVGLIALSPPRLSYSSFCAGSEGAAFRQTYGRAEELIAAGQPASLMEVHLPLPYVITAAGFVEKYGPDERYNYSRLISGIAVPTLVTFGGIEVETNIAFQGCPEALEELSPRHFSIKTIALADHFYTGQTDVLQAAMEEWLRTTLPLT